MGQLAPGRNGRPVFCQGLSNPHGATRPPTSGKKAFDTQLFALYFSDKQANFGANLTAFSSNQPLAPKKIIKLHHPRQIAPPGFDETLDLSALVDSI